jgi:hypothetical protein
VEDQCDIDPVLDSKKFEFKIWRRDETVQSRTLGNKIGCRDHGVRNLRRALRHGPNAVGCANKAVMPLGIELPRNSTRNNSLQTIVVKGFFGYLRDAYEYESWLHTSMKYTKYN